MSHKTGSGVLYRVLYIVIMVVIVGAAIALILSSTGDETDEIRVGCVLTGTVDETGWNGSHYIGVMSACADNEAVLSVRENVAEDRDQCTEAVNSLVNEGCNVIFLTSFGYAEFTDELTAAYPKVHFYANGARLPEDNVTYYFGRMYQARYLAGIVAGLTTKTNILGYVAAMPNSEVNRGINAFALGARSVNPDASVIVRYTGSWDDAEKEKRSAARLAELSADVIAYQQNLENVPEACDAAGINFIGCYRLNGEYSEHYLTSVECSWDKIYGNILRDRRSGRSASGSVYWLGIENDAVGLTNYSENVSVRARYEVMFAEKRLLNGQEVFSGEIYDNSGVLRCAEGEVLSDNGLITGMDWLAEGVSVDETE